MQNDTEASPRRADIADLVVVGAGIVGLAHAAEAHRRGLRVTVVERDWAAVGASVRNFGHIAPTVQGGRALEYAWVARERWLALGKKAGFEVLPHGTLVLARTDAEAAVLEEFAAERGNGEVRLLTAAQAREQLRFDNDEVVAGAHLPKDLRVNAPAAVPALAAWLEDEGVEFLWGTQAGSIEPGVVHTARGDIRGDQVVLAGGHDLDRLFPDVADAYNVRRCRLQMLEVEAPAGITLGPAVLTGTAMIRYGGLAALPSAKAVRAQFERDQPEVLGAVLNLMATQRPDGTVVLGDTHHYDRTSPPFDDESVAELVLREGARLFGAPLRVRRRWRGVYAHSPVTDFLVAAVHPRTRVVSVTSGIGMTTALGLAPAVLDELL